jgi:hypothetical protein
MKIFFLIQLIVNQRLLFEHLRDLNEICKINFVRQNVQIQDRFCFKKND